MNALLLRLVCGLLFAAMALGALARPPHTLTEGLGMLLPAGMLLNVAIKGPRRSLIPKRRASAPPPEVSGSPQG